MLLNIHEHCVQIPLMFAALQVSFLLLKTNMSPTSKKNNGFGAYK
jgi:hypothetical protein